jgi:sialidase-1
VSKAYRFGRVGIFASTAILSCFSALSAPLYPDAVTVFTRDAEDAYKAIRIPAIVQSKQGTLLAFAEGRPVDNDHGQNDIILRRSEDGGKTWGVVQVVAASGDDSLNDPCALALADSDRVFLVYQRYPEGYHGGVSKHTKRADLGYDGPTNTQSFMIVSKDDGKTWSAPRDMTCELRRPDAIAVGSPGNFIQLTKAPHEGRIVLPLYENSPGDNGRKQHFLSAAFSDDLGETWRLGGRVSYEEIDGWGTEAQIAETGDGTLLMSARNQEGGVGRILATSRDCGETWEAARFETALKTPPCMSSLVALDVAGGKRPLFHTLPNTEKGRKNGQLYRSDDGGDTWIADQLIYPDGFAYSALVVLRDGRLGCLYERDSYKTISYVTLDVKKSR